MIDLIIPSYNAYDTIERTLLSVLVQSIKDKVKVYIVDDASSKSYEYLIDLFGKYLDINIIKLDKNVGPGLSREEAIKRTDSKYIVFLDSDDLLYSYDSLEILFNEIDKGYDYVSTREFDEKKDEIIQINGNLHGKIYRRSYLVKNNIHFNDTRYHEDNYFNNLVRLCTSNYVHIDDVCSYIYTYNKNSITNKDDKEFDRLEIYLKNMKDILDNKDHKEYDINEMYLFKLEKYNYLSSLLSRYDSKKREKLLKWYHIYDDDYFKYEGLKGDELAKKLYRDEFRGKIDFKLLESHLIEVNINNK